MPVLIGISPARATCMAGQVPVSIHSSGCIADFKSGPRLIRDYWEIFWPWWLLDVAGAQVLVRLFTRRKLTLALAESCTGGLICDLITDVPGASKVLTGGVVTYTKQMKERMLDIGFESLPPGGVAKGLTQLMADQARQKLAADVGLAVTGVLGPGIPGKGLTVGQVYGAVSAPWFRGSYCYSFSGERRLIKENAARAILNLALTATARWDS